MATLDYRFKVRGGLAAALASLNEVPLRRELIIELDDLFTTGVCRAKIGDGTTHYNDLPYLAISGASGIPYDWIVALGDERTAITTGAAKITIRVPRAMTLTKIKASLSTPSSSGALTFDVKKNGVSVFSTALTIDASETTSDTATTPAVLSTTSIIEDDQLTFDIVDAGTGAIGAKITLIGSV